MDNKQELYLKEFYTLEQLSKELDFNIQTLRIYVKDKRLKASKIGTKYVITRESIKAFLKENEI